MLATIWSNCLQAGSLHTITFVFCQAQFKLVIAVAIETELALLSIFIHVLFAMYAIFLRIINLQLKLSMECFLLNHISMSNQQNDVPFHFLESMKLTFNLLLFKCSYS